MKTLIALLIILGVIAVYFIFNAEKSFSLKNANEAAPAGTDIARFIFNKALKQFGKINPESIDYLYGFKSGGALQAKLTEEIKSRISGIGNRISAEAVNLIKKPIEDKARSLICPIK